MYQDLIPYLGGIVPGMMSPGKMDIDPSALLIGGMMPGILNMATGGSSNLSKPVNGANGVGLLNNNDFGFGQQYPINQDLLKVLLANYMNR
jgi:hypothetical protein